MPAYLYNVLTPAGAALIAQATAANPIVWVGALSKATAAASAEDLAVKDAAWYDGKAGEIVAVSATDNVARPVAAWRPSGARQAALSLCVTARLASQTDADAVVMSAMSDPDSTVVLPGADDTGQTVGMPFPIDINAADSVAVTPGASASLADLERFVSLHKAGDPTAGDEQDILGDKHFLESVSVNGNLDVDGFVDVGDGIKTDVISARSPGNIEIGNTIVPATDEALDLGSEDYRFWATYTRKVYSNDEFTASAYNHDNDVQMAFLMLDASVADKPKILLETSDTDDNRASFYIRLANGRCEITAYSQAALGTTSVPFDEVHASTVYTGHLRSPGSSISVCSLEPFGTAYIGTQGLPFDTIQSLTFKGAEYLPDGVLQSYVGKNGNRFKGVYADELHGVIPTPSTQYLDEPEVGAIFFAGITVSGAVAVNAGATAKVGAPLSSGGSNVTAIGTVAWDMQTNKFTGLASFSTSAGSYKLLCGVNKSSTDTYCCALVIRVS